MVASTVSSKFLSIMAKQEGFTFAETLTGSWHTQLAEVSGSDSIGERFQVHRE